MWQPFERLSNLAWEFRLGISTRGKGAVETDDKEHIYYGSISYSGIEAVLNRLLLTKDDVFVDLGCGKGRVVSLAARQIVKEVIGIEYSGELVALAEKNSRTLRGRRSPVRIVHASVDEFDYAQGTVFYVFHAFGPLTLDRVVTRLHAIYNAEHRSMRLAYVWPMHESILKQQDWLDEFDRWEPDNSKAQGHLVSFWRTRE